VTQSSDSMKIVLVAPEIPGNAGAVGRTCVALDLELILIKPYGFDITEKAVRRAGLDYWQHVRLTEFDTWAAFEATRGPRRDQLFFFEEFGRQSFFEPDYPQDAYLVFGQESKGLSSEILAGQEDRIFHMPMRGQHIRSLNLANAATAVAYQAIRPR
jgi:tRNA (cytidine/uridine-2'-O-)-methyltransferase